ncbi:MAG: DUF3972 domain-containing protein [Campylobacterales bacterium]|nr:DUF3972 domain-containing protein [Campylobacterales bacterium]
MAKLMKPSEYAQEVGISRQAVYAKIKRGILKTKTVEGKLYLVLTDEANEKPTVDTFASKLQTNTQPKQTLPKQVNEQEYKRLLAAKDETIQVLKNTVDDLKESNKQMSQTLRGEIDLLKQAFYEMRTLYVNQIEQMKPKSLPKETIDVSPVSPLEAQRPQYQWVGMKKFLKAQGITKDKEIAQAQKRLKKAYKNGDKRLSKIEGKLKIDPSENYKDILA